MTHEHSLYSSLVRDVANWNTLYIPLGFHLQQYKLLHMRDYIVATQCVTTRNRHVIQLYELHIVQNSVEKLKVDSLRGRNFEEKSGDALKS